MKRIKKHTVKACKKVIATTFIMTLLNGMICYAGTWDKPSSDWKYYKDDGQYAKNEWIQDTDGAWYYFDRFGDMVTNRTIERYYVAADGKRLIFDDSGSPLLGDIIYGTCYIEANSYQDLGDSYLVNVSMFDSSFGTNDDWDNYKKGDPFWLETKDDYGTVTNTTADTNGDISLTVMYGNAEYIFTATGTFVSSEVGEGIMLREVNNNVEVIIPKNIEIIPALNFPNKISLNDFLNSSYLKLIPVFEGSTVKKGFDDAINHAG